MAYQKYLIYPIQHALSTEAPDLHTPFTHAGWGTKNGRIDQRSWKKRWGYNTADRTSLGTPYDIVIYQLKSGTRNTLYLNGTDLCQRKTGASETYKYITEVYTTGTIDSITDTAVVGSGTTWSTNVAAGDYFIMDDDHSANIEPDANWVAISEVTDNTHITLASAYTKNGTTYKIRKIYSVPSNERWWHAVVDDMFIFGNGDTNVQKWTGANYTSDLDSTYAIKARYGVAYSNRLVILDHGTTRNPLGLAWSANGDPEDWTDSTAGSYTFIDTGDYGTGLGVVGNALVVYLRDRIYFGYLSGDAVGSIDFPTMVGGIGNIAPYSIVDVMDTNAFLGRDDFYVISGGKPVGIGTPVRDKFREIVDATEAEHVFGYNFYARNEIEWIVNTSEGKLAFVWNYKLNEWSVNEYIDDIVAMGRGAV